MKPTASSLKDVLRTACSIPTHHNAYFPSQKRGAGGESIYSVSTADGYIESEPTIGEWFREVCPSKQDVALYVKGLFPFVDWIGRYNLQWLYGDLVAGMPSAAIHDLDMTDRL